MPSPFLVLATQNPIESEGTYPLPEAQLDRFMMNVVVDYPDFGDEMTILHRALHTPPEVGQVLSLADLRAFQVAATEVYVDRRVAEYAATICRATRAPGEVGLDHLAPYIGFGASPRGGISLLMAARALALLRGRGYVLPRDVETLALDVLRHRLVLTYQALADEVAADSLISEIVATIQQPTIELSRGAAR